MEAVVEDLRAKLRAAASGPGQRDTSESRLEFACTHGTGHVLVTGADRGAIEALLDRVIGKTESIGTVRGNAADPASTVDRLIALLDSESEVTGHLDRRRALLQLLARAQDAQKSIFVVVDDADVATVEELERLRTTLEVAPDAIERLRLVILGDNTLSAKLDATSARALRSRITSRIRVSAADEAAALAVAPAAPVAVEGKSFSWSFAASAAVSFAVISYATVLLMTAGGTSRVDPVIAHEGSASIAASIAAAHRRGLDGTEPFLTASLRIPTDKRWVTGSALFPPAPAVAPPIEPTAPADVVRAQPSAPAATSIEVPQPIAAVSKPDVPARDAIPPKVEKRIAPAPKPIAKADARPAKPVVEAPAAAAGSSIAEFRSRFGSTP